MTIITGRMRSDIEKFMRCFPHGVSQSDSQTGTMGQERVSALPAVPSQTEHSGPALSCRSDTGRQGERITVRPWT